VGRGSGLGSDALEGVQVSTRVFCDACGLTVPVKDADAWTVVIYMSRHDYRAYSAESLWESETNEVCSAQCAADAAGKRSVEQAAGMSTY
jgi:hypothetical protein